MQASSVLADQQPGKTLMVLDCQRDDAACLVGPLAAALGLCHADCRCGIVPSPRVRLLRMVMGADEYLLDNKGTEAGGRFDALSAVFDEVTFGHIDALGIRAGWRCREVGAGGPSVPAGLAARVGETGSVLATDIEVGWLTGQVGAGWRSGGTTSSSTTRPGGTSIWCMPGWSCFTCPGVSRRCSGWRPRCVRGAGCWSRISISACRPGVPR